MSEYTVPHGYSLILFPFSNKLAKTIFLAHLRDAHFSQLHSKCILDLANKYWSNFKFLLYHSVCYSTNWNGKTLSSLRQYGGEPYSPPFVESITSVGVCIVCIFAHDRYNTISLNKNYASVVNRRITSASKRIAQYFLQLCVSISSQQKKMIQKKKNERATKNESKTNISRAENVGKNDVLANRLDGCCY